MGKIYGYCRISRSTQSIERQERNIKAVYPSAHIEKEAYTGTKIQGRKKFEALIKTVKSGDTIVFDSVSRMSRNAEEGVAQYMSLLNQGVNLVFLKERYINTDVYKESLKDRIELTGKDEDILLDAVNKYLKRLAEKQIRIAFEQAQKEVDDLHQRTSEGMLTAKLNGKQIGQPKGAKLTTKKSIRAKEIIQKYSKDFDGGLDDQAVITLAKISRNSFYKYKRDMRLAIAGT